MPPLQWPQKPWFINYFHWTVSYGLVWIRLYLTAAILDWHHILLTSMRGHACKGQLPAIEETKRSSAIMPNRDHCCVPQCQNNRFKNIPNLTFHKFPSDESIRKQWIVKIRRDVSKSFQVSGWVIEVIAHMYRQYLLWSGPSIDNKQHKSMFCTL